jgi:hypothetical protein
VCDTLPPESGTVNLFLESGYVVHKVEESAVVPIYSDDRDDDNERFAATLSERRGRPYRNGIKIDYLLKFAIPALVEDPQRFARAVVRARPAGTAAGDDVIEATTTVVENVGGHVRREFEAEQGKVVVRAIVRALAKYAAKEKADNSNAGLGVLLNVLAFATETADTRSWSTLPQHIYMGRLHLPPGAWDLDVTLLGAAGEPIDSFTIDGVDVESGVSRFLNYRIY